MTIGAVQRGRALLGVRPRGASRGIPVLFILAACVVVVALLPLAYLMVRAVDGGWATVVDVLVRERTAWLVLRSLGLAATVTAGCLVLGIGMAWLTTRSNLPWRGGWLVLATLPLAVPSYVAAFVWISAFPGLSGFAGSAIVLTLSCYPYVLLPVSAALRSADTDQEEVARSLGKGPVLTFFRVTLPQVQPAAAAGALLAALYVLSDFGAVSIMRFDAFTRVIYTSYQASFDRTPAAILGCVLVVATLLILWGEQGARGRARHSRVGAGASRRAPRVELGGWRLPAVASCAALAAVAVGLPVLSIVFWMVQGTSTGIDGVELTSSAGTTLLVSAAGAALATVLALPVGLLAARHSGLVPRLLERATWVSYSLPGVVVALSLVYFSVRYAYPLYQQTPLLVAAYAVLFLPAAVGAVRSAVAQSPPVLEDVARSLGLSRPRVFLRVTLPLAAPGIGAGAALVFLTAMKELPATLMLRPTGMETMATRLWTYTEVGAYGAAAPYAGLLILLAAAPAYLLGRRANAIGGD